ncbi:hypothetical protein KAW44_04500, partial [Candidatus Bipolaricaulota bacterium]|nr:hypothetical protein [Candidatus Bipolaricaulota bacterium]
SKRNFELLRANPLHPSLHFKKVSKFWSVRAGINHRTLAVEDGGDFIWVWIGTHNEYEQMIGSSRLRQGNPEKDSRDESLAEPQKRSAGQTKNKSDVELYPLAIFAA